MKEEDYLDIIEKLWSIIDDIDTYSDIAKSDDKLYRALVERRQKDRWENGFECDGYNLKLNGIEIKGNSSDMKDVLL